MKKRFSCWSVCLVVLLLLVTTGLISYAKMSGNSQADLQSELAAAKKEGLPITFQDIFTTPAQEGENAAGLYRQAFAEMKKASVKTDQYEMRKQPDHLDPDLQVKLSNYLANFKDPITKLEAGSKMPRLDFERNWSLGSKLAFPEIGQEGGGINLLVAKGALLLDQGKTMEALDEYGIAARITNQARQEPIAIATLFAAINESAIMSRLKVVLQDNQANQAVLDRCKGVIAGFGKDIDLAYVLRGDVPMGLEFIRELANDPKLASQLGSQQNFLVGLNRFKYFQTSNQLIAIRHWRHLYAGIRSHPDDYAGVIQTFKESDQALMQRSGDWNFALMGWILPIFSHVAEGAARTVAERRVMLETISILEERSLHGKALSLTDPFTNKPLEIKHKTDSLTVFSLGPNLSDDVRSGATGKTPYGDDIWCTIKWSKN